MPVLLQGADRADHHTLPQRLNLCPVSLTQLHVTRFTTGGYNPCMSGYIWPRPLQPGGVIGICSPAGGSPEGSVERGAEALRRRGYKVIVAPHACASHPAFSYLAGTEQQRRDDLNGLIRNPEIDCILAARGGYGSGKLLDQLDWESLRRDPKALVGYSDITALNLAFAAQGMISYSGIMATSGDGFGEDTLDPFSEASFFQALRQEELDFISPQDAPLTVHRGSASASGRLVPVCLSLLESLASTKFVPDLTGALLLIEDITEELYAVDRALTQLRLNGTLEKLSGLLIGSFNGWKDERDAILEKNVPHLALEMTPESVAVVSGFAYGHIARRFTLPVGAQATVDFASGTIHVHR
jgi:muramoyltetrapeptide carboxypeptidase